MLKVAVIEGGYSNEAIISRKSAETIIKNLDKERYASTLISIGEKGWFAVVDEQQFSIDKNDFSYIDKNGKKITFDFAYIIIHGTPGEDGKLQAYFDMIGLKYSTSPQDVSSLTFNKFFCNKFLKTFGINVADAVLITPGQTIQPEEIINQLGLPCFVKPADGGSSFGVTKVENTKDLPAAIEKAARHGEKVIIESFLQGREVTNGIYRSKKGHNILPVTEIITPNSFFDFEAKYNGESQEITPAPIGEELTLKVRNITLKVAKILNIQGIARIDYIIVKNEPYLIEVNTIPGMSSESLIPQQATINGITLTQLLTEVIEAQL